MGGAGQHEPWMIEVVTALCDTFVPKVSDNDCKAIASAVRGVEGVPGPERRAEIEAYCKLSASDIGVPQAVLEKLESLAAEKQKEIKLLLRLLSSTAGTFALTGYAKPFPSLAQHEREAAMLAMSLSVIQKKRVIFTALKAIILNVAFSMPVLQPGSEQRENPFWKAIGFDPPIPASKDPYTHSHGYRMEQISGDMTMEVDILIVGSGCGGGVMAAEMAAAGKRVLVLEKGHYHSPSEMTHYESDSFNSMYERKGTLANAAGTMSILAGTSWGGGTTVNWSCCLRTQGHVREEWANKYGLKQFVTHDFQHSLDAITERMGVSAEGVQHNGVNQAFLQGCHELGYDCQVAPQNLRSTAPESNPEYICLGDRRGNKQSTAVTFLEDASRHGARFVANAKVERILHGGGVVTGAEAMVEGRHRLQVRASTVVVACGSLHSPTLLLRSGLRNPNIGKNLRLHPVTGVFAIMPQKVDIHRGAPMTSVSNVGAAGPRGDNYGYKLEIPSVFTGLIAAVSPWEGGAKFKDWMLNMRRMATGIVLQRDISEAGQVTMDSQGEPCIHYSLDSRDAESMADGLIKLLRIFVAAGAEAVGTSQPGVAACHPGPEGVASEEFTKFEAQVRSAGVVESRSSLFSAHQMGTCRMGTSPSNSVVDPDGQTWEIKGLFVADASTFPSSSGTNPMLTTLAVAHLLAQKLKRRLAPRPGARTGVQTLAPQALGARSRL